jgi:serine/threonine protein phosphatase 1
MAGRVIAIGDIHGCAAALRSVLDACAPESTDTVVTLGDYGDRGPDTRGVLEQLLDLAKRCQLVPILGNHDEMLLGILAGHRYLLNDWLTFGGDATLASYDAAVPEDIPAAHVAFLRQCRTWYETKRNFFVHASYVASLPLKKQSADVLRWKTVGDPPPGPHRSQKCAIVGHTSQRSGQILDLGYLKCIDTYVYGNGWLTALDVHTGQVWQADKNGNFRP